MSPIQLNSVKFMNKKSVVTSKVLIDEAVQSQKKIRNFAGGERPQRRLDRGIVIRLHHN